MKRRRVSLLGILLIIVVLLGLTNLGILGAKALAKPARPAPGELLYATTFEDASDSDWYQYRSALTAQIADGVLGITADSLKSGVYSDLNYVFNDFDVRVVARQTMGDDPYNEYGVLFRYQDSKNYYMFKVRADGAYLVERSIDGKREELSAATNPEQVKPVLAIGLNRTNDLRVVGKGDHFQFYINGQLLTLCPKGSDKRSTWNGDQCASNNKQTSQELVDSTFPEGKIALGVYENNTPISVAFDNLLVYSPTE